MQKLLFLFAAGTMIRVPRRVVITGIGLVTPLGCGNVSVWEKVVSGESGIGLISNSAFVEKAGVHVAATVPHGDLLSEFNEKRVFGRSVSKEQSKFIQYANYASDIALEHAGNPLLEKNYDSTRAGVAIASGVGSLQEITDGSKVLEESYRKLSPYFIPKILINLAAGQVSVRHKLQGPCHSAVTACAAGAHSIGDAANFIRLGYADLMLAGGSESCITPLSVAGFGRMKALSCAQDPIIASMPFDAQRDGFVMGEGAAVLVLEELEMAKARGAPILAELTGYGLSGDGEHITTPSGGGAVRSMRSALDNAGLKAADIDYVNAHATSTPTGDVVELRAIAEVFGSSDKVDDKCVDSVDIEHRRNRPVLVSSTKGATGHMLGAAGAVEAAFCVFALQSGQIPPTLNLHDPVSIFDPDDAITPQREDVDIHASDVTGSESISRVPFEHVPLVSKSLPGIKHVMSNSFGFGGTNASLIFSSCKK